MYNGIGLKTTRGSGTNGYIQRNLSNLKPRDDFRSKDRQGPTHFKSDLSRPPQPDAGILDHERKRKVEIRCMELQDELEDQSLPTEEIEEKVAALRKLLQDQLKSGSGFGAPTREEIKMLRPSDTHALRVAKSIEEAKMSRALRIGSDYKEGDAFDRELQEKKKLQRMEERRMADEARRADWEREKALDADRRSRFDAPPPPSRRFEEEVAQLHTFAFTTSSIWRHGQDSEPFSLSSSSRSRTVAQSK